MRLHVLHCAFEMQHRKKGGYRVVVTQAEMILIGGRAFQKVIKRHGYTEGLRVRFIRANKNRPAFLIINHDQRHGTSSLPLEQRAIMFVNKYADYLLLPAPIAVTA